MTVVRDVQGRTPLLQCVQLIIISMQFPYFDAASPIFLISASWYRSRIMNGYLRH
ncbi:hypothetical protein BDQ12DRAFT_689974 [Crucibulum laeve]|uniref:Uncharacterized protein n=1 Tax=Crucibulum laeve TaxID=68775 RepID=A0A5C3LND2_9AGAR|nr:hypothetical protein BDQ12DRAFT_689974 [Crucibulum laeve]